MKTKQQQFRRNTNHNQTNAETRTNTTE